MNKDEAVKVLEKLKTIIDGEGKQSLTLAIAVLKDQKNELCKECEKLTNPETMGGFPIDKTNIKPKERAVSQ